MERCKRKNVYMGRIMKDKKMLREKKDTLKIQAWIKKRKLWEQALSNKEREKMKSTCLEVEKEVRKTTVWKDKRV